MEHLDARDMSALALTCRRAHRICVGHTSAWARLCYLNWGIPTSRLTPSSLVCRLSLEANEHFSPANPLLRPGASAARRRMLENRLRDTLQQREESEMRAR